MYDEPLALHGLKLKKHENLKQNLIHYDGKSAQDRYRNKNHNGMAPEFVPGRPSTLPQFLARLLHISRKSFQVPGSPKPDEHAADDDCPDADPN
jgi:hypothetical protein